MVSHKIYDALILGGGPAGLSVALGLARQNRSCLVISNKKFRNDGIEASHAVLGHDHVHPQKILAQARQQIERYRNTEYAEAEIVSAEKTRMLQRDDGEKFLLRSSDGRTWTGRTLVLAAGVRDIFPDLEGYRQNWPQNIYQCLFCDGWERRNSQKAVLSLNGITAKDVSLASMALGQNTDRDSGGNASVTILSNGLYLSKDVDDKVAKKVRALQARGVRIDQRRVMKLENPTSNNEGVYVHLEGEDGHVERKLFGYLIHKPPTELRMPNVIEQLGVTTEAGMFGSFIKVSAMTMATSVPGVFAAGDCANLLTHVTTAMMSGISAASGIAQYLNEKEDDDALEGIMNRPLSSGLEADGTGCYAA